MIKENNRQFRVSGLQVQMQVHHTITNEIVWRCVVDAKLSKDKRVKLRHYGNMYIPVESLEQFTQNIIKEAGKL